MTIVELTGLEEAINNLESTPADLARYKSRLIDIIQNYLNAYSEILQSVKDQIILDQIESAHIVAYTPLEALEPGFDFAANQMVSSEIFSTFKTNMEYSLAKTQYIHDMTAFVLRKYKLLLIQEYKKLEKYPQHKLIQEFIRVIAVTGEIAIILKHAASFECPESMIHLFNLIRFGVADDLIEMPDYESFFEGITVKLPQFVRHTNLSYKDDVIIVQEFCNRISDAIKNQPIEVSVSEKKRRRTI
eukprot:NODE_167_length_14562_cov_0.357256.p9 type:complete len:245 gc:universal NODE_167_length_14562_cov_0.357256:7150-6416(-)